MIMGFNPFSKKSWNKVVDDTKKAVVDPVVDAGKQAADAAAKVAADAQRLAEQQAAEAKKVADAAAKATADAAAKTAKVATDTVNTINKTVVSTAGQAKVAATKSAMVAAKVADAALNDIEAGSKLAVKGLEQGAYAVQDAGELIAEWAEANYCQIGVSTALGTIFAALLYRPEPSSVATTTAATAPLSSTAIAYLAAKETVGAVALGTACDLTAALCKSIDAAAGAMIVPQACAAVVAGVVTTLVAQLACERTLPNGAREWATTGASGL